jgi:anthranilate phosphoribosyltransferase
VAKHGNRSVSSKAGSADVMEAAGCALEVGPQGARTLLDAAGFAFLFAPVFHPAMANVAPVRRALGVRTLFNLLGPLTNPALAQCQLLGVYDASLTEIMAQALKELGTEAALVIHCDGLDEIGLHDITRGHLVKDDRIEPFALDPKTLGLEPASINALRGGDAKENHAILRLVLEGEPGPRSDVVALNAGAALYISGLAKDLLEGLEAARAKLANRGALRVLERYAESSQRAAANGERH